MKTEPATLTLADEASRYLEAIELLRALGLNTRWRSEAVELGRPRASQPRNRGNRLAGRHVRINGRRLSFGS
jgi:hypothetical protein